MIPDHVRERKKDGEIARRPERFPDDPERNELQAAVARGLEVFGWKENRRETARKWSPSAG